MICPQCGYDMGHKNKCLRCGYEVKTLTVVSEDEREDKSKDEDKDDTIVIDPMNVFLTHPYGYDDDFGTGYGAPMDDPFVSIIDSLFGGDPFADLLGGLFGFGPSRHRQFVEEPRPTKKKKQGPIIVVDDIEIIDPNKPDEDEDNESPPEDDAPQDSSSDDTDKKKKIFKRNKNRK